MHSTQHPDSGKTVLVEPFDSGNGYAIHNFLVEDWWDRLTGGSWMFANGNPAALKYAMRAAMVDLPLDDEVVYGKDNFGLGHLVHVSELRGGGI